MLYALVGLEESHTKTNEEIGKTMGALLKGHGLQCSVMLVGGQRETMAYLQQQDGRQLALPLTWQNP